MNYSSLRRRILLLAITWCCAAGVFAHDPAWVVRFREVGVEEGLLSRFLYGIYQDTDGYMWFATPEGLNRYDGHRMEAFNLRKMGSEVHIPRILLEDCAEHLWLVRWEEDPGTGKKQRTGWKVDVLDPFHHVVRSPLAALPFPPERITAMGHIPGQVILLGNRDGQVFGYDGSFYLLYEDATGQPIDHIAGTQDKDILIQAGISLTKINAEGELLARMDLAQPLPGRLRMDAGGIPLVVSRQDNQPGRLHLSRYFLEEGKVVKVALPQLPDPEFRNNMVLAFSPDGHWALSYPGFLGIFTANGKLVQDLSQAMRERYGSFSVSHLCFDRLGGLWLSHGKGIVRITWDRNRFRHYLHHPPASIRGMAWFDDSLLLVANYGPLLLLNTHTGKSEVVAPTLPYGLGVCRDTQGYWWVGVHNWGFYRLDPDLTGMQAAEVAPVSGRMSKPPSDGLVPFVDRSGKLWLGFAKGLGYWDPETCLVQVVASVPGLSGLDEKAVNAFLESEDGLWVGSSRGLYQVRNGVIDGFVEDLASLFIYDIYRDRQGYLWLATRGDGLIRWDPVRGTIRRYTTRIGLISDIVYGILPDEQEVLWLSTNAGLVRFNPWREEFSYFRAYDGLIGEEFNYLAARKGADGRLFFGGLEGITAFYPDSIRLVQAEHIPIHISEFLEWDPDKGMMTDRTAQIRAEGRIVLSPPIQSFQLSFSPMGYQLPQKFQYAYWVEGLEPGWTFLDQPTLQLARIPPGHYILHLNGRGENGQWSSAELRIPLWVQKPFYQRSFFWVALVLVLGGIGVLYYRWNLWWLRSRQAWLETEVDRRTQDLLESQRLVREQYLELEKLNQVKDKLFLVLAHELKNPVLSFRNVSQKINYLLHRNEMDRLRQLGATLDRTASNAHNLLDNLLQWAKTQRGTFALHPRIILLHEAFDQVIQSYRDRAAEKNIRLMTCLERDDVAVWADPTALQVLLRNLVDNAVKFTPAGGKICLCAQKVDAGTLIEVRDTGLGMGPEAQKALFKAGNQPGVGTAGEKGTGLGLLLVRELMSLHGGSLEIESEFNRGTTFALWFPLRENPESPETEHRKLPDSITG